jgi:hypothetical protein
MLMRWPLAAYACSILNGTGLNTPGSLHADCDDHSTAVQMPLRGLRPARTRRRQRLALPQPERQRCRCCGQRRVRNRQNSSASTDAVGSPFGSQGGKVPCTERLGIAVMPGERLVASRHPRLERLPGTQRARCIRAAHAIAVSCDRESKSPMVRPAGRGRK